MSINFPCSSMIPACRQAGSRKVISLWSKMYTIDAIKSEHNGRIYVGFTCDLYQRLNEHNKGYVFSTKGYIPWRLIYEEKVVSRADARKRERYLKSGVGKEFLKSFPL